MKLKTLKKQLDNYFIFGDSEKLVIVKNNFQKNRFKILNVEKDFDDTIYIIIENKEYTRLKGHDGKYYCGICGHIIEDEFNYCPHCGERIKK